MREKFDVIIIGAGPAGASAAIRLAQAGKRILIIEKARLPRYKVCGGGLVWRARQAVGVDISSIIEREFYSINWQMEGGMQFSVQRDYPLISMVMRDSFDALLVEQAVAAGAIVHDEESFQALSFAPDAVDITTDKGHYSGAHLIAADGVLSAVHRYLQLEDHRIKIPAVEAEISLDNCSHSLFENVIFDVTAIRRGYGWVFPKSNHLSIGVAAMPSSNASLNQAYKDYLVRLGIAGEISHEKKYGFQIPLLPHKQLHFKNVLFVGDAAGLADPLVAEGISHAIFSGLWAAEALTSSENPPAEYSRLVKTRLNSQVQSARLLARLFYDYPMVTKGIMKRHGQYITDYVSDIFAGTRKYPDSIPMVSRSIHKLFRKR